MRSCLILENSLMNHIVDRTNDFEIKLQLFFYSMSKFALIGLNLRIFF